MTGRRDGYVVTPLPPMWCSDCGERLDQPHVLGAHLPGCTQHPIVLLNPRPASKSKSRRKTR